MNIIETNGGYHDLIKYQPIEKQVFEILSSKLNGLSYRFEGKFFILFYEDITIYATIKKSVKLEFKTMSKNWDDFEIKDPGDHSAKWPSVSLRFNVDISKPLNQFLDKIKAIQECKNKAKPIFENIKKVGPGLNESIVKYLNGYFGNQYLEAISFNETRYFFNGHNIGFYIKPIGKAPADGIYLVIEEDGRLDFFWNNSTPRRTSSLRLNKIEDAYSKVNFGEGISGMKSKIEAIEDLQRKVDEFDYTKCPELVEMITLKKEANKIKEEVSNI